jgi:epoxyqueuosine reductase
VETLSQRIKHEAKLLHFDAVGITHPLFPSNQSEQLASSRDSSLLQHLHKWLEQGYHGTMEWMGKDPTRRSDPTKVLQGCQSLICVGINYSSEFLADEKPGNGRIARYAWGQDYHKIFKTKLKQLEKKIQELAPQAVTRCYVDTGPIMEKAWAQQAGIGWIGKHSNLVSPQFGSWLLLGEILTTLELDPDDPGTDLCGSCSLCIQACPTNAIPEPYVVDATQCISYLTIEFRGTEEDISEELQRKIGNRIFGCDDCIDICPFNHNAQPTQEAAFLPQSSTLSPNLDTLSQLTAESFNQLFSQSPVRRAKLQGFLRNIYWAMKNHTRKQLN